MTQGWHPAFLIPGVPENLVSGRPSVLRREDAGQPNGQVF